MAEAHGDERTVHAGAGAGAPAADAADADAAQRQGVTHEAPEQHASGAKPNPGTPAGAQKEVQPPAKLDRKTIQAALEAAILDQHPSATREEVHEWASDLGNAAVRQQLRLVMTTAARDFSEQVNAAMDRILMVENNAKGRVVRALDLPRVAVIGFGKLALWQGDICRLEVGAIVNAANSGMLGCFRPDHPVRVSCHHGHRAAASDAVACCSVLTTQSTVELAQGCAKSAGK